ncbi:AI-2E family transporter [Halostagnicola kamekurae]|uniref:Predicted PurR-regulated permease PerM n=1 Tax=Halostagnicola kamekurae TaxID=619731 RepID=A0A1I6RSH6_9EURY|nr:AI-2E family transporter [Halostagnicola kamekurae]SFS67418.1 Predicted PurR-regulated permease PerM [Halostagnicola kamekurae]
MNRRKGYLLALLLAFGYLSLRLLLPFAQYVLVAILIAYVLAPLQRRLERRVSAPIAAFSLVVLAVVAFFLPFLFVVVAIAEDAARIAENVDAERFQVADIERVLEAEFGLEVDIASTVADSGQQLGTVVLEQSTAWVSTITHALIGLGLALFLIYYLLRDGGRLYGWIREMTPLPDDVQDDLYTELNQVMRAVLLGHVLIAIVQGTIAGLGLLATGVPNAALWTVVMIVLALVPLVGAFLVWGPAVVYLLLTNEPILAVALFVYSATIVAVSDDYLRPIVVDRYADINPAVIIVGVLGGAYAFGIMGLFFGPVALGAFIAVVHVIDENYDRLERTTERRPDPETTEE